MSHGENIDDDDKKPSHRKQKRQKWVEFISRVLGK